MHLLGAAVVRLTKKRTWDKHGGFSKNCQANCTRHQAALKGRELTLLDSCATTNENVEGAPDAHATSCNVAWYEAPQRCGPPAVCHRPCCGSPPMRAAGCSRLWPRCQPARPVGVGNAAIGQICKISMHRCVFIFRYNVLLCLFVATHVCCVTCAGEFGACASLPGRRGGCQVKSATMWPPHRTSSTSHECARHTACPLTM